MKPSRILASAAGALALALVLSGCSPDEPEETQSPFVDPGGNETLSPGDGPGSDVPGDGHDPDDETDETDDQPDYTDDGQEAPSVGDDDPVPDGDYRDMYVDKDEEGNPLPPEDVDAGKTYDMSKARQFAEDAIVEYVTWDDEEPAEDRAKRLEPYFRDVSSLPEEPMPANPYPYNPVGFHSEVTVLPDRAVGFDSFDNDGEWWVYGVVVDYRGDYTTVDGVEHYTDRATWKIALPAQTEGDLRGFRVVDPPKPETY